MFCQVIWLENDFIDWLRFVVVFLSSIGSWVETPPALLAASLLIPLLVSVSVVEGVGSSLLR